MTPSRQMRSFCYTTKSKNEERFVGAGFHLVLRRGISVMSQSKADYINVIGAGLAGSEAAYQIAKRYSSKTL